MAIKDAKHLTLDDTIWTVVDVLAERPEVSVARLKEIAKEVSGMDDPAAKRARILELAGRSVATHAGCHG